MTDPNDSITVTREELERAILKYCDSLVPTFNFIQQDVAKPIPTTTIAEQLADYLFTNAKAREEPTETGVTPNV